MVRHRPNTMEQLGSVRTINSYDLAKLLALSSDLAIPELFPLQLPSCSDFSELYQRSQSTTHFTTKSFNLAGEFVISKKGK